MLQSPESKYSPNAVPPTNSYTPVKPATSPMDQATIGRSLVIKGEVSGAESLFIDGRVEGSISFPDHRITIEEGAILKGGVEVRNPEKKDQKKHESAQNKQESPKAMAATPANA